MIQVRTRFPQNAIAASTIYADLEVQFAGQTAHYHACAISAHHIRAVSRAHRQERSPLLCSDFKIDRPSFLTVPIKNEIPVRVDMTWLQQ